MLDRRKLPVNPVKNYYEYILLLKFPLTIIRKFFVVRLPINLMHYQELNIK